MMTVVPLLRTAPTEGNMPARIFHSTACSAAWCVNSGGSSSFSSSHGRLRATDSSSSAIGFVRAWNSTSRPAAPSPAAS